MIHIFGCKPTRVLLNRERLSFIPSHNRIRQVVRVWRISIRGRHYGNKLSSLDQVTDRYFVGRVIESRRVVVQVHHDDLDVDGGAERWVAVVSRHHLERKLLPRLVIQLLFGKNDASVRVYVEEATILTAICNFTRIYSLVQKYKSVNS